MNNILKYIICCLLPLVSISCVKDEMYPVGNETIVLSINGGIQTKAVADTDVEAKVSHLDVVIFDASEAFVHHERITDNGTNRYALAAKRTSFVANDRYHVYVIANSTAAAADYGGITLTYLKTMLQSDPALVFTGMSGEGDPEAFLMDAVAYTSATEPSTPGTVVLNDGVVENSTELKATLRRAAAKIFVNIKKGADVTFAANQDKIANARYYLRNYAYTTTVIDGYEYEPELMSSSQSPVSPYFTWEADSLTVTAYSYAHEWLNQSIQEKETSLIVNIPLTYKGKDFDQNWYKIPLSKNSRFDRNTYYSVTVSVNAPGAENIDNPVTVSGIEYDVIDWTEKTISVGGDSNRPKYLDLSTNSIKMFNVNEDSEQITFASSSKITSIELTEAYYYNKHNQRTSVPATVTANISATPEADLNGNITVFSPIVETTAEERQAMIAALGTAPSAPSTSRPVSPEVPVVNKPDPNDYLPSSDWYTYYYEGTEGNYTFYRRGRMSGRVEQRDEIKEQYDADWAEYQKYLAWLANPDRDRLMAEYQAALDKYESENKAYFDYQENVAKINATATPSHYNTVRYLTFVVTNEQGLTETFTVEQYPVIYITNSLGWYSYRKDFKRGTNAPTTYQTAGPDRIVSVSLNFQNGQWSNSYSTSGNSGYWFSKVRTGNSTTGNTTISWYSWQENATRPTTEARSTDNVRLYHVHVTSTSKDYVVGRPKMSLDEKSGLMVTDPSASNARLVSPSFMIASRLGYFITNGGNLDDATDAQRLEIFRVHCANYVEVHGNESNPIIYDGWRLPTEAELKIIMDTQGEEGENAAAVDYLLNAGYYFGAAGPVWNSKNDDGIDEGENTSSKSVRCVRDAY